MNKKEESVKKKFWDEKSLRCMGISTIVHLFLFVAIYIAFMPAGGNDGEDLIEVSLESVVEDQEQQTAQNTEEYQPDLSENIDNIEDDLDNIVEDSYDESQYIQEQYSELQNKDIQANKEKQNIGKNLVRRSKYGPLSPRMFYGVRIFARSVIFVLDASGSMDIREAKLQLRNAYHSLKTGENFNIVLYSDNARRWRDSVQPATEENKDSADQWLQSLRGGGSTNMYDGLRLAFEIARRGKDTIFFLTDGHPNAGKVVIQNKLLQVVQKWNSGKNVVVHTIGLGAHQVEGFLKDLATQNKGKYYKR